MFEYIADKVAAAPFVEEPFRHIHIGDLLKEEHLAQLLEAPEIRLPPARDDEHLFALLSAASYTVVPFPGCTVNAREYLAWHAGRRQIGHHPTSEGAGMALRLGEPRSEVVQKLKTYIESADFNRRLAEKFDLDADALTRDAGIQKYLDGYEISPHPDTRKKALTFMVNLNPHENAAELEHHTHYLRLKPERSYVQSFWEGNPTVERCFVPWSWCETVSLQSANNSMVVFRPGNDTLHAVRARYDHLAGQRTQLYGNLWYPEKGFDRVLEFRDLDLLAARGGALPASGGVLRRLRNALDARLGRFGRGVDYSRLKNYD